MPDSLAEIDKHFAPNEFKRSNCDMCRKENLIIPTGIGKYFCMFNKRMIDWLDFNQVKPAKECRCLVLLENGSKNIMEWWGHPGSFNCPDECFFLNEDMHSPVKYWIDLDEIKTPYTYNR